MQGCLYGVPQLRAGPDHPKYLEQAGSSLGSVWYLKSPSVLSPPALGGCVYSRHVPSGSETTGARTGSCPLVPHTRCYSRRKLPARVLAPSLRPQGRCSVLAAPQPQQARSVRLARAAAGSDWLQITELTSSPCPLPLPDNAPNSAARLASCRALNTVLTGRAAAPELAESILTGQE